jgi:hypothetical protein
MKPLFHDRTGRRISDYGPLEGNLSCWAYSESANFLDAYGAQGSTRSDTLLGNHATKIFHRNADPTTNEWASKVITKETT